MKLPPVSEIIDGNGVTVPAEQAIHQPEAKSLPNLLGRYGVIYVDPPWHFATYSPRGEGRSAAAHYKCMMLSLAAAFAAEGIRANCLLVGTVATPMVAHLGEEEGRERRRKAVPLQLKEPDGMSVGANGGPGGFVVSEPAR